MAISEAINAISSAIKITKRLNEISKDMDNLIADLSLELMEVKLKLVGSMDENTQLRNELTKLKIKIDEGSPIFRSGVYYKKDNDGPFCTACFDNDGKFIHLKLQPEGYQDISTHQCPVCNELYNVKE